MATKLENLDLEIAHFEQFRQHLPRADEMCPQTVKILIELGMLQVSTAFEHVLATLGNTSVISEDHADLANGDDGKLATVRTCSSGTCYSAPVTGTKNKTGALRVQVFERKQNKFYYFVIPFEAHSQIKGASNIEIPFELDGTPRRVPKRKKVLPNWWDSEVKNLDEVGTKGA